MTKFIVVIDMIFVTLKSDLDVQQTHLSLLTKSDFATCVEMSFLYAKKLVRLYQLFCAKSNVCRVKFCDYFWSGTPKRVDSRGEFGDHLSAT